MIGEEGRKVKCTRCGYSWHQDPLEELADTSVIEPPPVEVEEIKEYSNLPAISQKVVAGVGTKATFLVLLILAIISGLLANPEIIPSFANILGMQKTDGLIFSDFSVEKKIENNRFQFRIDGKIINNGEELRHIPDIQATLLSKGGRVMGKLVLEPVKRDLEPGESLNFRPEINNISGNADKLILDIGNGWELTFR